MQVIFLAGLPRSGSTLLANLLAMHPDFRATPSSPLCSLLSGLRRAWSDDPFLLSQLDDNFDAVHERMRRSMKAFVEAWSSDGPHKFVVDKNRGWLGAIEWMRCVYPDIKVVVTVRDLRGVYASIEKRHRNSLMMDFPDHMDVNSVDGRANALFDQSGIVGSVLRSLQNLDDFPRARQHVWICRFEDLVADPEPTMRSLFSWIGADYKPGMIDFSNVRQTTSESDSYHRMKYPHVVSSSIKPPESWRDIPLSQRVLVEITTRYRWFYDTYYPDVVAADSKPVQPIAQVPPGAPSASSGQAWSASDENLIAQLEARIQKEVGGKQ